MNLRASKLLDVQFDRCVIDELDLGEAHVERLAFRDCTLRALRFDHAQLRHVDLRGLDLESISGVDSLRGAVVSSTQAVDLARIFADHLGITVVDERSDT